ncbi:FtsW/RodA/SpoVE family cell cycle protein, partial [Streptococcus pyogenes]
VAVIAAVVVMYIPVRLWQKYSGWMLLLSSVLLLAVLAIGRSVNGAARWISIAGINVQPAEIAKLSLFVFLAGYLTMTTDEV